jgi:hypothetical protein
MQRRASLIRRQGRKSVGSRNRQLSQFEVKLNVKAETPKEVKTERNKKCKK